MEAILERRDAQQSATATALAWVWAVGFLVPGILGFVPNPLLGPDALFVTNTAHNLVHVVTAVAFVGVALLGNAASVWFMKTFGVVYLLVGVAGFIVLAGNPTGYLLGLVHFNNLDNFLHLGLGAGILASGYFAASTS